MKYVTIPLDKFLRLLIGYKEFATVDKADAEGLKNLDVDEEFCHVEPTSNDLYKIYTIKDWRSSIERNRRLKEVSEMIRVRTNAHREAVNKVIQGVAKASSLDVESASMFVDTLKHNRSSESIVRLYLGDDEVIAFFDKESVQLTVGGEMKS